MTIRRKFSVIGVMIVLATLFIGCGPSKEQLRLKAQKDAKAQAKVTLDEIQRAPNGDTAVELNNKLVAGLQAVWLDFRAISVTSDELNKIIADKYLADAKTQLVVLRNRKTGSEAAQAARVEFYRTQKLSGRGLVAFGVTAKGVDALVAAANRRAPAKKRPT